ncbi:DUF413 domain-containing protein [Microvirga arsenatis]|uniref:Macrodomain Ori protein n=1 Tax=Microvirga arsenatis TaxID=2692265 RepID=A0ABW9Z8C8_9HYPH|nr:DUF413 domain-containing protein [Microvirga arsenatis]NBJ13694.1 hypothetical protein [Microvirga arsenatis]NBJ27156.1 hypothetical protein [Microvirga arsenatis]
MGKKHGTKKLYGWSTRQQGGFRGSNWAPKGTPKPFRKKNLSSQAKEAERKSLEAQLGLADGEPVIVVKSPVKAPRRPDVACAETGLTLEEVRALRPYAYKLARLERGEFPANTDERVHFVEVCRGHAEPRTIHEKAYLKWRGLKPNLIALERKLLVAEMEARAGMSRLAVGKPLALEVEEEREERKQRLRAGRETVNRLASQASVASGDEPKPKPKRKMSIGNFWDQANARAARERGLRILNEVPKVKAEETWGSREDWKRDRASWKKGR